MPEVRSAQEAIDFSNLAIEAGVDIVNLYGPASLHGYRPTDPELTAYFDEVLSSITHPVTLAPNPVQGYTPNAALIANVTIGPNASHAQPDRSIPTAPPSP